MQELRNKIRYRLSADAVFAWEGLQHNRLQGKGITRDISLAGTFIFTPTSPPVGAKVEVDIFLAPPFGSSGKKVRIRAAARVTRVEHSETCEGFAAVSQDFKLLFSSNGREQFCISSPQEAQDEEEKGKNSTEVQEAGVYSLLKNAHGSPSRIRG
jgi:PilZ domain